MEIHDPPIRNPRTGTKERETLTVTDELLKVSVACLRDTDSRGPSQRGPSHFCEFYLQEFYQVLTVNIREKSPRASCRGREKEAF